MPSDAKRARVSTDSFRLFFAVMAASDHEPRSTSKKFRKPLIFQPFATSRRAPLGAVHVNTPEPFVVNTFPLLPEDAGKVNVCEPATAGARRLMVPDVEPLSSNSSVSAVEAELL